VSHNIWMAPYSKVLMYKIKENRNDFLLLKNGTKTD
jgi:hypothetical protein